MCFEQNDKCFKQKTFDCRYAKTVLFLKILTYLIFQKNTWFWFSKNSSYGQPMYLSKTSLKPNFGEVGSQFEVRHRGDFQTSDILVKSKLNKDNPKSCSHKSWFLGWIKLAQMTNSDCRLSYSPKLAWNYGKRPPIKYKPIP